MVAFPACITGHMTRGRGSASGGYVSRKGDGGLPTRGSISRERGVCIQGWGGSAAMGRSLPTGGVGQTPPPLELGKQVVRILLDCVLVTARKLSLGQGYVFTRVCDSVHRVRVPGQVPPPGMYTPGQVPPHRHTPLADTPPGQVHTSPAMHAGIRSTSGRYASYWNAFLLTIIFIPFGSIILFLPL